MKQPKPCELCVLTILGPGILIDLGGGTDLIQDAEALGTHQKTVPYLAVRKLATPYSINLLLETFNSKATNFTLMLM